MASFLAEEGILKGLELSFEEGEKWIIGRDPDESNLILEDPKVSRKHLLCTRTDEGFVIENLSESNPVIVNDREILGPTLLHDGDRVLIGSTLFRFREKKEEKKIVIEEEGVEKRTSETIFRVDELPESEKGTKIILPSGRFIFKVVAGPNTGAEIVLDEGKSYLIGTDSVTCDIVFHDLSVSREHARLTISEEGILTIEDLGSRNGVIIDKERISGSAFLTPNRLVAIGTSLFIVIDKKAPLETVIAPSFEEILPKMEEEEEEKVKEAEEVVKKAEEEKLAIVEEVPALPPKPKGPPVLPMGPLLLTLLGLGLIVLIGVGIVSLFNVEKVEVKPAEYNEKIEQAIKTFPGVKFSFVDREGKLLLVGHVVNGVEKNELLYKIQNLPFVKSIQDEIVDDEAITQEMNILLSKNPAFQGVTIYAPDPGCFLVSGYLKNSSQLMQLSDFLNLNFNFLSLLKYKVIVEDQVVDEIKTKLTQAGFPNVVVNFASGLLTLTGYIPSTAMENYSTLVTEMQKTNGVKVLRNYVVTVSPEESVIDLKERYPGRYEVSGYSKQRIAPSYPPGVTPVGPHVSYEKGYPTETFPGEIPGTPGGGAPSGPVSPTEEGGPTPTPPTPEPPLPPSFAPAAAAPMAPPGAPHYEVTGMTKHCDVNINVVINGRLLMRGDVLDGMTITSIQPGAIYLERDGLKYKIEYNK